VIASDSLFDSFGLKLSNEDIAEIECLRDVAMATNFGTIPLAAIKWTLTGDNDMRLWCKGWFVFSQPLRLLVACLYS